MRQFTIDDLESLALGSAILGSGGGGNPAYDLMFAKHQMMIHGPINMVNIEELDPDGLIVPIAFMGAPLVCIEKIRNGNEFVKIFKHIETNSKKKITAIMPIEIGGGN